MMKISHLHFTDDMLIMCDAMPQPLLYLHCTLLLFEAVSRLKINPNKTEMVPIGEVENMGALADILECKISTLVLIHLGLPLGAQFKAKAIRDGILERIKKRLAG